ncbi:hypothetical protein [Streptomyces sp. NPDC090036]|uniref:hypothetical protein n=1 Tax=Streptomyces sp. NPDC090036 TaxID=3365926 RepID=UPI0037FBD781
MRSPRPETGPPDLTTVGYGVKETSKVTPCEIDFSPSDEERARLEAELQAQIKEHQGIPAAPPAGTSSSR